MKIYTIMYFYSVAACLLLLHNKTEHVSTHGNTPVLQHPPPKKEKILDDIN